MSPTPADRNADAAPPHRRIVRSFVRREGRMTPGQKRALDALWPRFGVDAPAGRIDLAALFGRDGPVTLEIGFGSGDHLLARAAAEPARHFLGVEVHRPGVGHVLLQAERAGLANLRVACDDAVEVLRDWLAEETLDEVVIYFPDPWPKKRHHKRRLVQAGFVGLVATRLRPGGLLKLATDWAEYAEQMRGALDVEPRLRNTTSGFAERPPDRPLTRFERRGQRLGHAVFDLVYVRVG